MNREHILHPIPPTWDEQSRVLILGSFPSIKSREMMYFYGHPQNRFWKVTAAVFGEEVPSGVADRRAFLLRNHLAVWDVIASCTITGSSDSSIKDVTANDLGPILSGAGIERIFCNGQKSAQMYKRYTYEKTGIEAVCLPSTSPANAAWTLERLIGAWQQIRL